MEILLPHRYVHEVAGYFTGKIDITACQLSGLNAKSECRNISKIEPWKLEDLVLNKSITATLIVGAK